MTLSLAADVLHYIPEELNTLAQHIQTTGGELTSPIMQVYEEDIRTLRIEPTADAQDRLILTKRYLASTAYSNLNN